MGGLRKRRLRYSRIFKGRAASFSAVDVEIEERVAPQGGAASDRLL